MHVGAEAVSRRSALARLVPAWTVLPVYAATLFLSAGLLFVVQPMISKMALPHLGGSPSVWTTCVFFFQATLLLGYTYAHGLTRWLGRAGQIGVHAAVLAAVSLALPVTFAAATIPPGGSPVLWLLGRLGVTVGPPVLAITATAPLLQRWFWQVGHPSSHDPYFLYAASNAGSLLALLAYPFLFEPNLALTRQSTLWTSGFVLLSLGVALSAAGYWARSPAGPAETVETPRHEGLRLGRERLRWIALAFVPSSLLLGVTAHITTDIAAAPLFWVVPLALYLLTFVMAFARRPPLRHETMVRLMPIFLIPVVIAGPPLVLPALVLLTLNLACFLVIAMVCHGELARTRPEVGRLTEFYFFLSLGGVLGGLFNAIVAPVLFPDVWEYPLALVAACFVRPGALEDRKPGLAYDLLLPAALFVLLIVSRTMLAPAGSQLSPAAGFAGYLLPALAIMSFRRRRLRFALGVAACVLVPALTPLADTLLTARSFFGVYRVRTVDDGRGRILMHGTTLHGAMSLIPGEETVPTGYYSREGPFGRFFSALDTRDVGQVGIIGLGTGGLACYAKPGQRWTFYEIDPLVERIARDERYFPFMARCGNHPRVVLGDGRLTLAAAPDGGFDVFIIDAFSSDSIPPHLLTKEALALYLRKLAAHGVLLFHISNRYLDLAPVIAALASSAGAPARYLDYRPSDMNESWRRLSTVVVAVAPPGDSLDFLSREAGWISPPPPPATALWTDQRSDIVRTIRWLF